MVKTNVQFLINFQDILDYNDILSSQDFTNFLYWTVSNSDPSYEEEITDDDKVFPNNRVRIWDNDDDANTYMNRIKEFFTDDEIIVSIIE